MGHAKDGVGSGLDIATSKRKKESKTKQREKLGCAVLRKSSSRPTRSLKLRWPFGVTVSWEKSMRPSDVCTSH